MIKLVAPHRIRDEDRSTSSQSQSLIVTIAVTHRRRRLDPGLRQKISSYHPNNHDEIRRHYLGKGPCRPPHDYHVSYFSGKPRRFRAEWYVIRNWLEYSIAKDAAFCFYCYIFEQDVGKQGGGDTFVTKGFKLWNQLGKLDSHVGGVNSTHNQAVKKSEDLQKEKQHIQSVLIKQSNQDKAEYWIQLNAIVDCVRFLLCRGLAFRGHDESQGSSDKGNFLDLLQFLGDLNESINEVMQNTWKNCKLTHHDIQKDMVNAIAHETSKAIIEDFGNGFFSILVDESRDISVKEQMALILRYRRDALRDTQFAKIKEDLEKGVRRSGQGLNQETNLKRPGDTRWGSYYGTILNLILMFSAVADVLEIIEEDGLSDQKVQNFIFDMRNNDLFLELQGVSELAEKLVSTRKHETYPLVYLLVKLALTLPVATATIERV
ncbi:uncharacterized protein LOC142644271 [Castanea sativa]|uniref:uncharacterized protein LOC142644271 n=1 Tax=Castanea sativa TaxID=21020 RepID=UPI003F64F736